MLIGSGTSGQLQGQVDKPSSLDFWPLLEVSFFSFCLFTYLFILLEVSEQLSGRSQARGYQNHTGRPEASVESAYLWL